MLSFSLEGSSKQSRQDVFEGECMIIRHSAVRSEVVASLALQANVSVQYPKEKG